jgi:hypothetical protein
LEGPRENRMKLLPRSKNSISFILHPLQTGSQPIPSFMFKYVQTQSNVAPVVPHYIFIHP